MKSPSTVKARKRSVKARKAYGVYINGRLESLQMNPMPGDEWPLATVAVLDLSPEVSEARVEAGAKAGLRAVTKALGRSRKDEVLYYGRAVIFTRAVLAALGLAHPNTRRGK